MLFLIYIILEYYLYKLIQIIQHKEFYKLIIFFVNKNLQLDAKYLWMQNLNLTIQRLIKYFHNVLLDKQKILKRPLYYVLTYSQLLQKLLFIDLKILIVFEILLEMEFQYQKKLF